MKKELSSKDIIDNIKNVKSEVYDLIQEKLDLSRKYLSEAEEISEKYGIPFYSEISPLSQAYIPESFEDVFNALCDKIKIESNNEALINNSHSFFENKAVDLLCEEADIYFNNGYFSGAGWERSAIC